MSKKKLTIKKKTNLDKRIFIPLKLYDPNKHIQPAIQLNLPKGAVGILLAFESEQTAKNACGNDIDLVEAIFSKKKEKSN